MITSAFIKDGRFGAVARAAESYLREVHWLEIPGDQFLKEIAERNPVRVAGTAIYMTGSVKDTPAALRQQRIHIKTLHKHIVLLTVLTENQPKVDRERCFEVMECGAGIWRIILHYGFMQGPTVPAEPERMDEAKLSIDFGDITFFIGDETLLPIRRNKGVMIWRECLFAFMRRNATSETTFYRIPAVQVIELGLCIRIRGLPHIRDKGVPWHPLEAVAAYARMILRKRGLACWGE